jgi:hypothetical protein
MQVPANNLSPNEGLAQIPKLLETYKPSNNNNNVYNDYCVLGVYLGLKKIWNQVMHDEQGFMNIAAKHNLQAFKSGMALKGREEVNHVEHIKHCCDEIRAIFAARMNPPQKVKAPPPYPEKVAFDEEELEEAPENSPPPYQAVEKEAPPPPYEPLVEEHKEPLHEETPLGEALKLTELLGSLHRAVNENTKGDLKAEIRKHFTAFKKNKELTMKQKDALIAFEAQYNYSLQQSLSFLNELQLGRICDVFLHNFL